MRLFRLVVLFFIGIHFISNASGQTNVALNIQGGSASLGNVFELGVSVSNTGPGNTGTNKVRVQISYPSAIVTALPNVEQTGLPAGWTVTANIAGSITVCNASDNILNSIQRNFVIKFNTIAIGGPSTVNGNLIFSNGISCTVPGSLTGDNTADNSGTSTIEVTPAAACNLTASASAGSIQCFGGTTTLTTTTAGGTVPFQYSLNGGPSQPENTFTVGAGTHTVLVTDANNCTATASATITQPTQLVASETHTSITCNGGSSTVTVSATGGTAPYTGTGAFSRTAGVYNFTVTDANGCTATVSATITQPTLLTASSSASACVGGTSTVTVSASGGTAPYTGTGTFARMTGTYNFTVTDANGCTATTQAVVSCAAECNITLSTVATNVSCNGGNNGAIDLSVSGASGTVTYAWSNAATTQDISGLIAGTYTVTVTDANSCTATASATVTQPTQLIASETHTSVQCNGGSSTVTVSAAGGTAPYAGTGTFSRTAGTYNFTVTDANGCTATVSATITQPTQLIATETHTSIACNGGSSSVTISASGGTAPYTGTGAFSRTAGTYNFTVTDANGCTSTVSATITQPTVLTASSSASACVAGISIVTVSASGGTAPYTGTGTFARSAGTYNFTVTDANGCTATTQAVVNCAAGCNITLSTIVTNVSCNGGSNGAIDLSVSGASGSVTYAWSNAATTQDISGLAIGTYTVTVTDANSCTATASATITQPTQVIASETHTSIQCNGGSSTVTVSATGGIAPYTGTGTFSRTAGTYNFTVTDANGCTAVATATITQPTLLVVTETHSSIACNGGSSTVTLSASGGTSPYTGIGTFSRTAGVYNFTVTDANGCTATVSATITQPTLLTASSSPSACVAGTSTVTVSASGGTAPYTGTGTFARTAGVYNFTVTDANGCTATTQAVVNCAAGCNITLSTVVTNVSCNGGNNGAIDLSVSGASGGVTYAWSNAATTQDISGLTSGTYMITVTDANSCTATASVTVTQPTQLIASETHSSIQCNGGSSTVTVNATGGTAPYTGTSTFSRTAGVYNFTVTDANGCTATVSATITQPTSLTASSSASSCVGGTSTVTISASGGTAPYTGTGTFARTTGTYNFTVTDANGCTATTQAVVNCAAGCNITLSTVVTNVSCNRGNNGTIDLSVSGATGSVTYAWSNAATTQDISGLIAGTYTVTVTDANNCTATASATVTEPTQLTASETHTTIQCNGGSSTVTVSATGGTASYTGTGTFSRTAGVYNFTVTDANGCSATVSATITQPTLLTASSSASACVGGTSTVTVSASGGTAPYTGTGTFARTAGTYNFTVTDANGCTATTQATVNCAAGCNITLSTVVTNVSCNGGSNGAIDLSVSGASGSVTYAWSNAATTQDISSLIAGTYTVTVTDASSCTATASVTVTQPTQLIATETHTLIACNGGSSTVTVSATGGTTPYTGTGTFSRAAGTYNFTITDANGCTAVATATITQPTLLVTTETNTSIACNGGSSVVTVSANGGTAPYTGTGTFSRTAGTYNFTVTDVNGCMATVSATIAQPTLLIASSSASACVAGTSTVTVSASGGTAPYTGTGIFSRVPGTYNFTVTDANGCTAATQAIVSCGACNISCSINVSASGIGQANTIFLGYGPQSLTLTAAASGGNGAYNFNWGSFGTGNSIVIKPGATTTYTLTVTDETGCSSSCSITIFVIDVRCGNKLDKVMVCHNGIEICISANAVASHLAHGDNLGPCSDVLITKNRNSSRSPILLKAYPNPASKYLIVEWNPGNDDKTILKVYDAAGRIVINKNYTGLLKEKWNMKELKLDGLLQGVYFLQITGSHETKTIKFVIH